MRSPRRFLAVVVMSALVAVVAASGPAAAASPPVTRVSVSSIGAQTPDGAFDLAMSRTGDYVAFSSRGDLGFGRTAGIYDLYLKDLTTGLVDLISLDSAGLRGAGSSWWPSISQDGRYVAFESSAILADDDSNGGQYWDVYLRDRVAGTTKLVSVNRLGVGGNGNSQRPAISADGRYVGFISAADNLVDSDNNQETDVFVKDLTTDELIRISVSANGDEGDGSSYHPGLSSDGRYVVFHSRANNLIPNDTNGRQDIFLVQSPFDPLRRSIERASLDSNEDELLGQSAYPSVSDDGRYVAFATDADVLVNDHARLDVLVRDRTLGTTTVLSVRQNSTTDTANGESYYPWISADGGSVAFDSAATDLVPADTNGLTDVFVWSRATGGVERVSELATGGETDDDSRRPLINDSGSRIGYWSEATNLVPGDINGEPDLFVTGTGVVGSLPLPPVKATFACEQLAAAILCDLTYSGGALGPPEIRWYVNGTHRSQYANQMTVRLPCTVGRTVRMRVVVTESLVPTHDAAVAKVCVAVPP